MCLCFMPAFHQNVYSTGAFHTFPLLHLDRRPPINPLTPGTPYDSIFAQAGVSNSKSQAHNGERFHRQLSAKISVFMRFLACC